MNVKSRIFIMFFCVPFLLCASGCGNSKEKAAAYVAHGDRFAKAGDNMRAILEYENALQLDPRNTAAQLALGKAYFAEKDYLQAYRSLSAVLSLNPGLDDARLLMARLLSGGQPQKALEQISKIRKPGSLQPGFSIVEASAYIVLKQFKKAIYVLRKIKGAESNVEAQKLLAISLQATGDFKAMMDAVDNVARLDPPSPFSYLFMAEFDADHGDKAGAAKELDAMVKAAPGASTAVLRARVFEKLKMQTEAEAAYEQLPDDPEMLKVKAGLYHRQGKDEKAQKALESLLGKKPADVGATLELVSILQSRGDSATSLKRIDAALKLDNKAADRQKLLVTKASVIADLGRRDAAIRICRHVLEKNQGNYDAHLLLGRLLLNAGKYEEAEIHLQQVVTAQPKDTEARILLAMSQFLVKKDAMAADTLNSGVKANPEDKDLRLAYFRFMLAKGHSNQAIKVMSDGLKVDPGNVVFLDARGGMLAAKSQYAEAKKDFLQMIKLAPDSAGGYIEMGRLMLTQSKLDKAIDWLKRALSAKKGWESAIPVLAAACDKAGDYKSCIALIESEAARRPSALAFLLIGRVYAGHKDLADAQKAFAKAVQLAPDWIYPHKEMAIVLASEGKIDPAIAQLEKMYRIDSSPSNALSLAMLYEQKGRVDDAGRLLDGLLRKSGKSPSVMNDLAYLYAQYSTDPKVLEKAAKLAAEAVAGQPHNAVFLDTAAWVSYKQGNLDAAWSGIQSALLLNPDAGALNLHAAVIAQKKGKMQEAKSYLDKALRENLDSLSRKAALDLKKQLKG